MNPQLISTAHDRELRPSPAAMKRTAERARQIAAQTGTALIVGRDGLIEHLYPAIANTAAAQP